MLVHNYYCCIIEEKIEHIMIMCAKIEHCVEVEEEALFAVVLLHVP